jgi:hypothetical protein
MYNTSKQILGYHDAEVTLQSTERSKIRGRRDANRARLKGRLAEAEKPTPIGMHTQGPYAMHTMAQDPEDDYDIDDGVYFRKEKLVTPSGAEMSALAVRQMVCGVLQDERFAVQPSVLKNCVRIYYPEGFHVDVPAYRRIEVPDSWTGKTNYIYELASSEWRQSDPREVTRWFKRQNKYHSMDYENTDGQFCRIVRLLKKFARSRSSWKSQTATGLMITKLVDECYCLYPDRDDLTLFETMKAIRWRLEASESIPHPTIPRETVTRGEDGRPGFFKLRLAENLNLLNELSHPLCGHSDAMNAWNKFFNTGWFSEQPPPDDESSGNTSRIQWPSRPVEKRGGGRYARWSNT